MQAAARAGSLSVGERSYPASKVRGSGREETPRVRGQEWLGEATSRPRPGAVTLKSHPEPNARGGSWEEPPTPEPGPAAGRSIPRSSGCAGTGGPLKVRNGGGKETPLIQGKRNPSKMVGVARGHQRADTLKPYS